MKKFFNIKKYMFILLIVFIPLMSINEAHAEVGSYAIFNSVTRAVKEKVEKDAKELADTVKNAPADIKNAREANARKQEELWKSDKSWIRKVVESAYHKTLGGVIEYFKAKKRRVCGPHEKYLEEYQDTCTLCPLFAIVFNAVSEVGAQSVQTFSSGVSKIVIVGFAIWLAMQVLAFASSIETQDLKDLVQKIITQGFIVMLVVIILKMPNI